MAHMLKLGDADDVAVALQPVPAAQFLEDFGLRRSLMFLRDTRWRYGHRVWATQYVNQVRS